MSEAVAARRPPGARRVRRHPLRWRLEAGGVRAFTSLSRALPEEVALRCGAAAGGGVGAWRGRHRAMALANLRVALPECSDAERQRVLRRSLAGLGRCAAAWGRLPSLAPGELAARVEWRGTEQLERAWSRGRGVLAVTAHYGFWELILPATRLRYAGGPGFESAGVTAVERAIANPLLREFVAQRRRLAGEEPLPQQARAILRALRGNALIGVLVDHYLAPRRGGVLAPFLGPRAWSNPGPATLARRTGAALVPVHSEPLSGGRHRVEFGAEIEVPRSGDPRADVALCTERVNDAIGGWVRARPELWLWLQRRWKRSPDLPGDLYPRKRR